MIVDTDKLIASFARHETFHPRYGWLRKAYEAAKMGPDVFSQEDATVKLGVGKNMVNAIRYWGVAFDLLDEVRLPGRSRVTSLVSSALADAMFCDEGWDPYLEDPASLWLLHWRLLRPPCFAPIWWLIFNGLDAVQFTENQALHAVEEVIDSNPGWAKTAPGSVKKDVDCVLRMYAPARAKGRDAFEDLLDCPFRELGLLEPVPGESRTYRWVYGRKATLPASIVAHASVDFMARESAGSTITLTRLATAPGSPGRAFKIPEPALYEALLDASNGVEEIKIASPGGIRQLVVRSDDPTFPSSILETYYRESAGSCERLSNRPTTAVVGEYVQVLKHLERQHDRLKELDLRQRRVELAEELATVGVRL
ncbi:MAG: DUF4007 family protein [Acidimicrobiales bacterium]